MVETQEIDADSSHMDGAYDCRADAFGSGVLRPAFARGWRLEGVGRPMSEKIKELDELKSKVENIRAMFGVQLVPGAGVTVLHRYHRELNAICDVLDGLIVAIEAIE